MTRPQNEKMDSFSFQQDNNLASPFQSAPADVPRQNDDFSFDQMPAAEKPARDDFFFNQSQAPVQEEAQESEVDEEKSGKREMIVFLLLLPGVVFFLFGLVLLLFSDEGALTLTWSQNLAIFYFLGSLPLIFLGWRALGNTTSKRD